MFICTGYLCIFIYLYIIRIYGHVIYIYICMLLPTLMFISLCIYILLSSLNKKAWGQKELPSLKHRTEKCEIGSSTSRASYLEDHPSSHRYPKNDDFWKIISPSKLWRHLKVPYLLLFGMILQLLMVFHNLPLFIGFSTSQVVVWDF